MGMDELVTPKREAILQLAARYGASNVRVFGSVARGEAQPHSDIDLLVDLAPTCSLLDHTGLLVALEDLLERPVDIVTEASLYADIRPRVLHEVVDL